MVSKMSGKTGFEFRGVVKPLALLVCRHLALLALCHLFSRQATTKSDMLYTYSVVAFGLALLLSAKQAFKCHIKFGQKARLKAALHSKLDFKRKRGKSERWRRSSAGCERVQALAGEKRAKMLGESDRERKLYDTSSTALAE
jgi:hypothetical protein